jgi:hypothetical protein
MPTLIVLMIGSIFLNPESDKALEISINEEQFKIVREKIVRVIEYISEGITSFFTKERFDNIYQQLMNYWSSVKFIHEELSDNPYSKKMIMTIKEQRDKVKDEMMKQALSKTMTPKEGNNTINPDEDLDDLDVKLPDMSKMMDLMNQMTSNPQFQQQMKHMTSNPQFQQQMKHMTSSMYKQQ